MKLPIGVRSRASRRARVFFGSVLSLGVVVAGPVGCGDPLEADDQVRVASLVFPANYVFDFDKDIREDLVFHHGGTGQTSILYGETDTIWNEWLPLPSSLDLPDSSGWTAARVADFDLDHKPDLLWHNGVTGETQVWFMNNRTRLGFTMLTASNPVPDINRTDSTGWKLAGAADFNNDGVPDILWHHGGSGATEIWHMNVLNRPRRFRRIDAVAVPSIMNVPDSSGWRLVGNHDFNLDGRLDLVWHHTASGMISVWFMSDTTFLGSGQVNRTLPPGQAEVVSTDPSDDGPRPHILWHNLQDGLYYRWVMGGTNSLTVQSAVILVRQSSTGPTPVEVRVTDPNLHVIGN
ncbi:MAG TPA: VCBS repeat-containing protein [Polyangia bacterium]|jgi:hypothetical protein|nr:VCBS repeat-containing protein [Polyangia bacterium]